MTIYLPLGVCWEFKGVIENKKCSQEKDIINWHLKIFTLQKLEFIVYTPWTYLPKTWTPKVGFVANAKIEDFKNKKSCQKIYSFQFFVDFSTDSDTPAIIFLELSADEGFVKVTYLIFIEWRLHEHCTVSIMNRL